MSLEMFIENVFEIAFGEDAINKDYTREEVLERLEKFAEDSWKYEGLEW